MKTDKKIRRLKYLIHKYQEYLRKKQPKIINNSKETRDNKDIHVGGGGSNRNKIRYPSKKRNKKTWSNFYKLFPSAAEKDHWDGKTSNKMK
jgi:hypothetical protein